MDGWMIPVMKDGWMNGKAGLYSSLALATGVKCLSFICILVWVGSKGWMDGMSVNLKRLQYRSNFSGWVGWV